MFDFVDDNPDATHTRVRITAPGKVTFDERGNAVYAWHGNLAEQDDNRTESLHERALLNPNLKLVDDGPVEKSHSIRNDNGLQMGYNPYQSGQLAGQKQSIRKKPDMRELSKWIEMKRRLEAQNTADSTRK